ncbi:hypothetical protein ARAM_001479 [Aspergillus rambellii]|uniref:Uncharacterized protein n=1 Tax=Aspergillus rambellii TaxID=308745 RepID=A0A0F8X5Z1_9EURO|nr:hypothetical protein ARAM_001479 [Aspergillus rambellii]
MLRSKFPSTHMDNTEILVHVSARSGAVDDARYRAQVEAILNFQAHSREVISLDPQFLQSHYDYTASTLLDEDSVRGPAPTATVTVTPRIPPPTPDFFSSSSSSHKRKSPSQDPLPRLQHDEDSLDSPVSVIPDSQPLLSTHGSETPHSLSFHPPSSTPASGTGDHHHHPDLVLSTPDAVPEEQEQEQAQEQEQEQKREQDPNALLTHDSSLPPPITIAEEQKEKEKEKEQEQEQDHPTCSPLPSLPLQIKPALPPVSSTPFVTHITPTLEMLTKRLKSPRTYNPTKQTRALDRLERGYWYLPINLIVLPPSPQRKAKGLDKDAVEVAEDPRNWDTPFFLTRFWSFLSDFIAKEGRAGWGVWCLLDKREPEPEPQPQPQPESESESSPRARASLPQDAAGISLLPVALKVYAWGEIASHIYLLLLLASERRIRKMGAHWRDSRDEVVIEMP